MNKINYLRQQLGIIRWTYFEPSQNRKLTEMLNKGEALPENIIQNKDQNGNLLKDANGNYFFHKENRMVPIEDEQNYCIMRISKDLHFIKILFQIGLIFSIIGILILMVIWFL